MQSRVTEIVPAIIANEWEDLIQQIARVAPPADSIQIDVMDGQLVPSISFPYNQTPLGDRTLPLSDSIFYEVHLMVRNPLAVGNEYIRAGAQRILPQIEGFASLDVMRHTYTHWLHQGVSCGASLLLETPISEIEPLVEEQLISHVQCMSITRIGYQGEKFDERVYRRLRELKNRFPDLTLGIDGGVKEEHILELKKIGVNTIGIGSAIMGTQDPRETLMRFRSH